MVPLFLKIVAQDAAGMAIAASRAIRQGLLPAHQASLNPVTLQILGVIPDSHRNGQLPLQDKESEFLSRCLQTRVPQLP
jgi:hypothetical protein